MRKFLAGAGVLLILALTTTAARAQSVPSQPPMPPYPINRPMAYCGPYVPAAPDFNHPAFYGYNPYCQPVVSVYPSFGPWAGALPPPPNANDASNVRFPTHPFARSPRDFFMYYEREQEYTPFNRPR